RVVDEATGRGVPLVELKTTNDVKHYTDSNGLVAFNEPGLMGTEVFAHVKSHGYEYPKDAFGYRGARLKPVVGGNTTLKLKRLNVAERLYRVTGEGVYRDSVLLGAPVPTEHPVLNGKVMGQDTVMAAVYRGKIFWLWGDTNQPGYPLGNFSTTSATSELPGRGGLDPSVGVNIHYYLDPSGFTRKMVPDTAVQGPGLKWLDGLVVLPDPSGRERLVGRYAMYKERGPDGTLVVGWKKDAPPLTLQQRERLVSAGLLKADELWSAFRDVETGKPVRPHGGSVSWSPYRHRWITIFTQFGGSTSQLGE